MTSTGRRAAIGLCAIATATTAGCAASPQYPIERGQAPGDGGVHMTERPRYPIDRNDARPAPGQDGRPPVDARGDEGAPPPPSAATPSDDEDAPRAPPPAPPVDSSSIPPPPGQPPAASDAPGFAFLDEAPATATVTRARRASGFVRAAYVVQPTLPFLFGDSEPQPGFELAAYHHHHHAAATTADDAQAADAPATAAERKATRRRRHGRAEAPETTPAAEPATDEVATAKHGRHRHGAKAKVADASTADAALAPTPETPKGRHRRGHSAATEAAQTAEASDQPAAKPDRRHRHGASAPQSADSEAPARTADLPASSKVTTAVSYTYEIKKGDTLYGIGRRFKLDGAALAKLNGLKRAGLQPGQTVELPTGADDQGSREHAAGSAAAHAVRVAETRKSRRSTDKETAAKQTGAKETSVREARADDAGTGDAGAVEAPAKVGRGAYAADRAETRRVEREARAETERAQREVRIDTERAERAARADLAHAATQRAQRDARLRRTHPAAPAGETQVAEAAPSPLHDDRPSVAATSHSVTRLDAPAPEASAAAAPARSGLLSPAASAAVPAPSVASTASVRDTASLAGSVAIPRAVAASPSSTSQSSTSRSSTSPSSTPSPAATREMASETGATLPPPASSRSMPTASSTARTTAIPATGLPSTGARAAGTEAAAAHAYVAPTATRTTNLAAASQATPSLAATRGAGAAVGGYTSSSTPRAGATSYTGGRGVAYATITPPPRAYASPGYTPPARTAASSYAESGYGAAPSSHGGYTPGQVATLNAPSYRGPTLGRARPAAPVVADGTMSNVDVASAGRGRFVWPLRGAILQPFGDRGPGQRNDGMDIAAQPGASVHAAAGGEVVYAGSSIPGFGNLVLVKHPGGWVTAYAHLDRIEVRMRDTVSQGEEIGQAGQTGAVTQPQLHFEVRYAPDANEKARPVDPQLVLPGAG